MFHSKRQILLLLISLSVLVGLAWATLGPIQIGGPVSYVIINGKSMEPGIKKGDLVVARKQSVYSLDERVVYAHPDLGYVFHRIVNRDKSQFILRGDNNDWLDSYHPASSEIIGSYWFSIPGAGDLLKTLRKPLVFTVIVMIIVIVSVKLFFSEEGRETNKTRWMRNKMSKKTQTSGTMDFRQDIILVFCAVAILALILGIVSFIRPLTLVVSEDLFYSHSDDFMYEAADQAGIYDHSGIETGDPIYPVLNCSIDLSYRYQLLADLMSEKEKAELQGSFRMVAVLSDQDGWNRTFLLIPDYAFTGPSVQATPSINICSVLEKITTKELKTGVENAFYTLSIQPQVSIIGAIAGNDFKDTFKPSYDFQLEQDVLKYVSDNAMQQIPRENNISTTSVIPNTISIFTWQIPVKAARLVAIITFGLSVIAGIYPVLSLLKDWNRSQNSRILVQYKANIVSVSAQPPIPKGIALVEMSSIDDLVKIAERYGMMILHAVDGSKHHYSLQADGVCYVYSHNSLEQEDTTEL